VGFRKQEKEMKLHDLLRIKEQPSNQYVQLKGEYAVVEEVFPDEPHFVNIATIDLTGATRGHGTVPVGCLEIVNETAPAVWRAAWAVYKQRQIQFDQQAQELKEQYEAEEKKRRKIIRMVAQRNGVEPKLLRKMLRELDEAGVLQ
jgi:hypothetical protein